MLSQIYLIFKRKMYFKKRTEKFLRNDKKQETIVVGFLKRKERTFVTTQIPVLSLTKN